MHDLQEGISNEYQYMQKMFVNVVHGELWGILQLLNGSLIIYKDLSMYGQM